MKCYRYSKIESFIINCSSAWWRSNKSTHQSKPASNVTNTHSLTHSWSWGLLEMLWIVQLLKNFPAFYETRRFITVFTGALRWSLSWARSIQSIPYVTNTRDNIFCRIRVTVILQTEPLSSTFPPPLLLKIHDVVPLKFRMRTTYLSQQQIVIDLIAFMKLVIRREHWRKNNRNVPRILFILRTLFPCLE
jgi:hypothetical protein